MEEVPLLFTYKILSYFKYSRLIFSTFCPNLVLSIISFYEFLQIKFLHVMFDITDTIPFRNPVYNTQPDEPLQETKLSSSRNANNISNKKVYT